MVTESCRQQGQQPACDPQGNHTSKASPLAMCISLLECAWVGSGAEVGGCRLRGAAAPQVERQHSVAMVVYSSVIQTGLGYRFNPRQPADRAVRSSGVVAATAGRRSTDRHLEFARPITCQPKPGAAAARAAPLSAMKVFTRLKAIDFFKKMPRY